MPPYLALMHLAGWLCWGEWHRTGQWMEWICARGRVF